MFTLKPIAAAVLVLGLTASGAVFAATEHKHDGHAAGAVQLTLDQGRKWPTDAPLRQGMTEMRHLVGGSYAKIHDGKFAPADYVALAGKLQTQLEEVTANCKLPEQADAQLHIVLAEIMEGMDAMKAGDKRAEGVMRIAAALDAYAKHFDHPGWVAAAH